MTGRVDDNPKDLRVVLDSPLPERKHEVAKADPEYPRRRPLAIPPERSVVVGPTVIAAPAGQSFSEPSRHAG